MVIVDLIIPEASDRQTVSLKPDLSFLIGPFLAQVGFAVEFHHQACLDTVEIKNKRTKRMLAAKLETGKSPAAQLGPQDPLGGRQLPAEAAPDSFWIGSFRIGEVLTPHPRPLSPEYRGEGRNAPLTPGPLSPEYRGEEERLTPARRP